MSRGRNKSAAANSLFHGADWLRADGEDYRRLFENMKASGLI
jgi:hypothetical protein